MTDREWLEKLNADLHKMKVNREKVPLEILRTRYERPYNMLVAELESDADWFAGADRSDSEAEKADYRRALVEKLDYNEFVRQAILFYDRRRHQQTSLF